MAEVDEESGPRVCNKFVIANLAAVVLGIAIGLVLFFYCTLSERDLVYLHLPGELLLQMLQSTAIPLIVSSVLTGTCGLSIMAARKITFRTTAYFASTTLLAVTTGLILVMFFKPGVDAAKEPEAHNEEPFSIYGALLELTLNVFPDNMLRASLHQYKLELIELEIDGDERNSSLETNDTEVKVVGHYVEGTNTLCLIVWTFIFGLHLTQMGEVEGVLVQTFRALNVITKAVFNLIRWYLPVGILFLIISQVVEEHDWETPFMLAKFMGVVLLGLVIHGVITLPLIYSLCTGRNPVQVLKGVAPALVTAFVISSSSATLPQTFRCCEERLRIDKRVSRFVLPIGTNVNMNGTVLYEVVAAVFIAQLNHIHLNSSQLITLLVTAGVSTVGAAGIPATGAMTTCFVLSAVGLPAKEVAVLVAIEWLLDRFNTVINVYGDCMGVALMHAVSQADLEKMEVEREAGPGADEAVELDEIQIQL